MDARHVGMGCVSQWAVVPSICRFTPQAQFTGKQRPDPRQQHQAIIIKSPTHSHFAKLISVCQLVRMSVTRASALTPGRRRTANKENIYHEPGKGRCGTHALKQNLH